MRRRSFLAALLSVPVVGPALAKTSVPSAPVPVAVDANLGAITAGALRSADGCFRIDFETGTIGIRDDLFVDGTLTVDQITVGRSLIGAGS